MGETGGSGGVTVQAKARRQDNTVSGGHGEFSGVTKTRTEKKA